MRSRKAVHFAIALLTVATLGTIGLVAISTANTAASAQQDERIPPPDTQFYMFVGLCHAPGPDLSANQTTLNEGAIVIAFGSLMPDKHVDTSVIIGDDSWDASFLMRMPTDQRIALANQWYVEQAEAAGETGAKDYCPAGAQFGYESPAGRDATIASLEERIAELESQVAALTGTGESSDLPPVNPDPDPRFAGEGIDESYAFDMKCGIALPSNGFRFVNSGYYLFHCERVVPFGFEDHAPKVLVFQDELLP